MPFRKPSCLASPDYDSGKQFVPSVTDRVGGLLQAVAPQLVSCVWHILCHQTVLIVSRDNFNFALLLLSKEAAFLLA